MILTDASERETVAALLRIQVELSRTLRQRPQTAEERRVWRSAISTMLIEVAQGRLFLSEVQERRRVSEVCPEQLAS
jgi:hypothetical protein